MSGEHLPEFNDPTPAQMHADLMLLLSNKLDEILTRPVGSGESSISIEDQVKGPKVTTKSYRGAPLTHEEIDAALEAHAYAHRRAVEMSMNDWQGTVEGLRAA